jgi:hypothetical protein
MMGWMADTRAWRRKRPLVRGTVWLSRSAFMMIAVMTAPAVGDSPTYRHDIERPCDVSLVDIEILRSAATENGSITERSTCSDKSLNSSSSR